MKKVRTKRGSSNLLPKYSDRVVVAGDVVVDFMRVALPPAPASDETARNWQRYHSTELVHRCGGALLIAGLLKSHLESDAKKKIVSSYHQEKDEHERWIVNGLQPEELVRSFATIQKFAPVGSDEEAEIFRASAFSGFGGPGPTLNLPDQLAAKLVVISEIGNGFRNESAAWPNVAIAKEIKPTIIFKCGSLYLNQKPKKYKHDLLDFLLRYHNDRLLVIINADDLRNDGALISRSISWERTAIECVSELARNPTLQPLKRCNNLLIRFGLEGAMHRRRRGRTSLLVYDHGRAEGDYSQQFNGSMSGYGSVFTASLAADIYNDRSSKINQNQLELYIRHALVAARRLLRFGLGGDPAELRIQHEEIFSRSASARHFVKSEVPNHFGNFQRKAGRWSFLDEVRAAQIPKLAQEIVKSGKMSPGEKGISLGRFGSLETIDRSEIESYRTIKNLMREFLLARNPSRPLSIAVFGQPGSGKSFGIAEIANDLGSMKIGNIGKRLTFNVAQFTSDQDLAGAFHQARDEVLKGEVPILFFDEFDAKRSDKPLYWLQYFLAPMQDGVFKDGNSLHSVGKVIFVFAGGIYRNFQEFINDEGKFKEEKLPDFKSRLRGYVNIRSLNPSTQRGDRSYLVRRAVILRSLLKRKCPQLINSTTGTADIDDGVLRAFLEVSEYKHDVRSMEALLDMSMLAGKTRFDSSALPTDDQMDMHVDPNEFLKFVAVGGSR